MQNNLQRETWTSRLGFILAAAGSAIGLGNIWRFPYVTGRNGGALFLLVYLVCIIAIGYPVMVSEVAIGRKSSRNPVGAFKAIAPDTPWWLVGALGVLSGFVILSYYSVVAGWSLSYIFKAIGGFTGGTDFMELFFAHIEQPGTVIIWHFIFMFITILVISAGVVRGIQKIVKVLMPVLLLLLVVLVIRSLTLEGAGAGVSFFLRPDIGDLSIGSIGDAIGQAFFTLSLGMGAMITYGSYLSKKDKINDNVAYVIGLDTSIAILAGFAIFPAVFALGMEATDTVGLTFITLPAVFAEMPLGSFFGFIFFLLLSIAALTSAISLLEVVVAYMVDEKNWPRKKASFVIGLIIFLLGIPSVLGYSTWEGFEFLGNDILDTFDFFANDLFLPLGGLLTAIFAGYVWGVRNTAEEANKNDSRLNVGSLFGIFLRYVVPVGVGLVLILNFFVPLFQAIFA